MSSKFKLNIVANADNGNREMPALKIVYVAGYIFYHWHPSFVNDENSIYGTKSIRT